jgi:hypothetical protein
MLDWYESKKSAFAVKPLKPGDLHVKIISTALINTKYMNFLEAVIYIERFLAGTA